MFVLRNRQDYREHLEHLLKMLQAQKKAFISRKKDIIRHEGIVYGIGLALEALAEREKQSPDQP